MPKFLHNTKVLIGIAVGVFVLLIGAGVFFIWNANKPQGPQIDQAMQQTVFPTIVPQDLGLTFVAKDDKKYVKFTISKAHDITHVTYDISYDAISPDDNATLVTQGLNGEIKQQDIKNGVAGIDWRILGTCSTGGKCRFDQGIKQVHLLLKITKTGGMIYQAESSLTL